MDIKSSSPFALAQVRSKRVWRALLFFELCVMDAGAILFGQMASARLVGHQATMPDWQIGLILLFLFFAFASGSDVYKKCAVHSPRQTIPCALYCLFQSVVAFTFIAYFIFWGSEVSRISFAIGLALAVIGIIGARILIKRLQELHLNGSPRNELLIIDGAPLSHRPDRFVIDANDLGLRPDLEKPDIPRRFGHLVKEFDRVVVSCRPDQRTAWTLLLRASNVEGEIVVPEVDATGVLGIEWIDGHFTHVVATGPLSLANRARKRALDLALVVPAIICLAPIFVLAAVAIKLDSNGPILFLQDRVGRNNQLFKIYKFRSMRIESEDANGNHSVSRDDGRVTRMGRFMRATSIDELPQLFNVLLGDMSLVGPRPHALGSLAGDQLFWQVDHEYWVRHALKPGITGLAQVRGFRGTTHTRSDLTKRLRADLEYIENWSIANELAILIRTAVVIVHPNAY